MAQELGSAYLALIPTLKGAQKTIESQLKGMGLDAVAKKKGEEVGESISGGMGSKLSSFLSSKGQWAQNLGASMKSVGQSLTSNITKPALVAASAMAGVVAFKGFTRLKDIDTAKVKLEALGHSAKSVDGIMKNAVNSVKGTSYALNEAATTAAGAVAAGVKQGKDLESYLSSVADAAAIANVPMEEMGSIFNRTQTAGRAYAMELNMLADRGIPIYQWLAKEAGISAGEVRKMAASGKVSSELYFKAIKKNIGGAAKEIGEKSFTGALQNIWASIARIGENFLDAGGKGGGFFTQLKPLMVEFKTWLGELELKAKDFGYMFGEAFKVGVEKTRELIAVFTGTSNETKTLQQRTEELKASVTAAFDWIIEKAKALKMWYDGLSDSSKKFVQTLPLIAVAAGPIMQLAGNVMILAGGFGKLLGAGVQFVTWLPSLAPAASVAFAGLTNPAGLAALAIGGVVASAKLMGDALHRNREAQDPLIQSTYRLRDANDALAAAKDNVKRAADGLKDAQANEDQAVLNAESAALRYEAAQKRTKAAKETYGTKSLEYRTALHDEAQAALDNENAIKSKRDAMANTTKAVIEAGEADRIAGEHAHRAADAYKVQSEAFQDAQRTISKGFIHDIDLQFNVKPHNIDFKGAESHAKTHGAKVGDAFSKAFAKKSSNAKTSGKKVGQAAVDGASGFSLYSTGSNLASGLMRGLHSQAIPIKNATHNLVKHNVVDAANRAGQIHSPSKLTTRTGKFLGMGLIVGLKSTAKQLEALAKSLMKTITNQFKTSGPVTYADAYEGAISRAKQYQEELNALNKSVPKKPTGKSATKSELARYKKDLAKWKKDVAAAAKGVVKEYKRAGENLAKAYAVGINSAVSNAKKGNTSEMLTTLDSLIEYARGDLRTKLLSYRKSLESVSSTIEDLNTRLQAQKDAMKSYADGIAKSFLDFSTTAFSTAGVDAQDYLQALKERLAASKDYASQMSKLAALGLNQAAIDQISSQGIEQGSAIAEALLSGADKSIISEMNALVFATEAAGQKLGNSLGKTYYQPEIDAINSQLKTAKAAADRIGAGIASAVKKELDKSGGWGKTMVENLASGIKNATSIATQAAADLAKKVSNAAKVELNPVGYNASAVASAGATTNTTTTNNFNVSIPIDDLKNLDDIQDFFDRLRRAGGAY